MAQEVMTKPAEPEGAEEVGMTLLDHVRELRDRLFKAVIALVIGAAVGVLFSERILQFLLVPYAKQLLVTSPTEALTNVFVVSLTIGATLALPVIVYQALAFIMPGLYPNERKWIFIGVPFGFIMFILGALFAYFIMLPAAVGFLTSIFPTIFKYDLKPDEYVPFVAGVMFWMGVAFEIPLLIFILAKMNVINARVLAKQWRIAIVVIAIIAAFVTPTPDPINMSIVMAPLLALYGLSIVLAFFARRNAVVPALLDPEERASNSE